MQEVLHQGPLSSQVVADAVAGLESEHHSGATTLFLGRVRADVVAGKEVSGIAYSGYELMAVKVAAALRLEAVAKFGVQDVRILHAVGEVKVGEVSILVMVLSAHRKASFAALEYVVDELKLRFPAWKKELFTDGTYRWIGEPGSG